MCTVTFSLVVTLSENVQSASICYKNLLLTRIHCIGKLQDAHS